jgi:signal transduction histidine kinase
MTASSSTIRTLPILSLMVWNPFRRRHRALDDQERSAGAAEDPGRLEAVAEPEAAEHPSAQAEPSYEELRSAFTAVVSHELRTPLARLLALLETAALPDTPREELLEQARSEVEQMRELVDEVLFLSELETGHEVVALAPVRALPVLERVLTGLRDAAERAGVRLRADGDPELDVPLRPRMLGVVAENLAENAIRYAGEGASFSLTVERQDGAVLLRAKDDGAGVPEPELRRIFERFYRADRARASRGSGLGLAIVKHIVTAAGGTVEAVGGPRRGLEIRCRFPA